MLRVFYSLLPWSVLLCVPGGVLWALSPVGVYLSEQRFHTPNVFWKLFPSAPLLLLAGLVGLYLFARNRWGWLERAGLLLALLGLVLILVGDIGEFWLSLDDRYIMTAPAYRAFRIGLVVFAVGSLLFGVAAGRARTLPIWGVLPFAITSLCGLVSFWRDLGQFGAALWILFGLGWAWLAFTLLIEGVARFLRERRAAPSGQGSTPGSNLYNPTPWSGERDPGATPLSAPRTRPATRPRDRLRSPRSTP